MEGFSLFFASMQLNIRINISQYKMQNIIKGCNSDKINSHLMKILSKQELIEKQLSILSSLGPSLSSYYCHQCEHAALYPPAPSTKQLVQSQYRLTNIKTVLPSSNSIFNILTIIILNDCINNQQPMPHGLMDRLKCILYSQQFILTNIVSHPHPQLTSRNMKKLLVQFLQIVAYHRSQLPFVLAKYQIVLDIFTIVFRNLLHQFNVKDANYYYSELNNVQAASMILDFFDMSYMIRNSLIVFQNRNLCIAIDNKLKQVFIGERCNESSTKNSEYQFQLNINDQIQSVIIKKQSAIQTPTPCFQEIACWDDAVRKVNPRVVSQPIMQQDYHGLQQQRKNSGKQFWRSPSAGNSQEKTIQFSNKQVAEQTRLFKHFLGRSQDQQTPKGVKYSPQTKSPFRKLNIQKMKHSQVIYNNNNQKQKNRLQRKQTLSQKCLKGINNNHSQFGQGNTIRDHRPNMNKLQSLVVDIVVQPPKLQKRYKTSIFQEYHLINKDKKQIPNNFNTSLRTTGKKFGKIPSFLTQKQNKQTSIKNDIKNEKRSTSPTVIRNRKQRVTFTYTNKYLSNSCINKNDEVQTHFNEQSIANKLNELSRITYKTTITTPQRVDKIQRDNTQFNQQKRHTKIKQLFMNQNNKNPFQKYFCK